MLTRRQFIQLSGAAGAGALLMPHLEGFVATPTVATTTLAFSQSDQLQKFITPLRRVGGTGIPVMQPDTVNPGW